MACNLLENVAKTLGEVINNIDPDQFLSYRNEALVRAIMHSGIINYCITNIIGSRLCRDGQKKTLFRAFTVGDSQMSQGQTHMEISQPLTSSSQRLDSGLPLSLQ